MTPRVIAGEMIYEEGFPSGESFFVRTRTQEEQLDYILGNVVELQLYNDLGESYNEVQEALRLEAEAHQRTKAMLQGTWIGISVTVVTVTSVALLVRSLR